MKGTFFTALSVMGVSVAASYAAVTLNLNVGVLNDGNGSPIDNSDLVMLVADVASDGFDEPVLGDFLGGTDDDIVAATFDLGSNTVVSPGAAIVSLTGLDLSPAGAPLRLVWFPENSVGDAAPVAQTFGFFQGDPTWVVPADGATVTLDGLDASLGGSAVLSETGVIVPEPSALALLFGCLAFFGFRRRK